VNGKPQEYSFDLGARPPVNQVNLVLPETNSASNVQLLSREKESDPWRPIVSGNFFRMRDGNSERQNAALEIGRDTDRYWLARFEQAPGAAAGKAPRLTVVWDAQDLVFLARGAGPYQIAYGSGVAAPGNASLFSLLSGARVAPATTGSPRALGGAGRMLPAPRTVPWKMAILWSVLGVGILLLGLMAYRLSDELHKNKPNHG
jgi:hypothetical protein